MGTEEEAKEYLGIAVAVDDMQEVIRQQVRWKSTLMEAIMQARKEFSYGMVVPDQWKEEKFSQKMSDPELAQMRNVAGEIKGSEAPMQYALDHKIPSIIIYHDYQGIASWCNGDWKANKAGTIAYRDFYRKAKERVHIEFPKS